MAYEKGHRILVPTKQKRLRLFIDETYLDNSSGVIQTSLIFPDEWYTNIAVPQARVLLGRREEFKGGKLTTRNRKSYEAFLAFFADATAQVGATNELRGWMGSIVEELGSVF